MTTIRPTTVEELRDFCVPGAAESRRILAVGGGTALPPVGEEFVRLDTTAINQIVDYPSRDQTITVAAGMTISALQNTLKECGQSLPIEVPQADLATVGGAIACDCSGPSRFGAGTFRDYVIGLSAVDGQGRLFSSGGRVVKNVAGYDLLKLMIGSRGRLGIITQVTFKVRPLPAAQATVRAQFSQAEAANSAIAKLLNSATRPMILDLSNSRSNRRICPNLSDSAKSSWTVWIGYRGSENEVSWQTDQVQSELAGQSPAMDLIVGPMAGQIWQSLAEFHVNHEGPRQMVIRAEVLSSQAVAWMKTANDEGLELLARAGNGVVWARLPESASSPAAAELLVKPLASRATALGGRLQQWLPVPVSDSTSPSPPSPVRSLAEKIKATFDPQRQFADW